MNELYVLDLFNGEWGKLECGGDVLSLWVVYGVVMVGGMFVVFGGIGLDGLVDEDLYVLDLVMRDLKWYCVYVWG